MYRILLINSILFFVVVSSFGQQSTNLSTPKWALKWNPIALLDITTPAIQVGAERRLGNKFSINAELGYLLNFKNRLYIGIESRLGARLRTETRYYWDSFMNEGANAFVGLAAVYRYTNDVRLGLVERYNAYTEVLEYHYVRHNIGGYITTGGVFRFKNLAESLAQGKTVFSPLSLELSLGLGLRMTYLEATKLPADATLVRQTEMIMFEVPPAQFDISFIAPSIQAGLRILYVLPAKK